MSGTAPTTVTATIFVYKGSLGLDWSEKRHTLLAFKFADGSKPFIIHAAGSNRWYRVEHIDDHDPTRSSNVVGHCKLGTLETQISKAQLIEFLSQTPVNNDVYDWNCQNWVGDALERMVQAGYITRQTWDKGLDDMVAIIADARDEHLR